MLGKKDTATPGTGHNGASVTLLTIAGEHAKVQGKFEITEAIQIECEIGGELSVAGRLTIGEKGAVNADVRTVDAVIMGRYQGNMVATGNVEITETGRVAGNIQTDSLVIAKGGFFNGNVTKINGNGNGDGGVSSVSFLHEERAG